MARKFVRASNQTFTGTITGSSYPLPITLACWVNPISSSVLQNTFVLYGSATSHRLQLLINAANSAGCTASDGTGGSGESVIGTVVTNRWQHIAGIFTTTTSRTGYLNGTAATTNTVSKNATSINSAAIGSRQAAGDYTDGYIGMCTAWSVALSPQEIACLAYGIHPYRISAANIIHHWSLLENHTVAIDSVSKQFLNNSASPAIWDPIQIPFDKEYFYKDMFLDRLQELRRLFRNRTTVFKPANMRYFI